MGKIYYIMGKALPGKDSVFKRNPKADAGTKSDHNVHDTSDPRGRTRWGGVLFYR